MSKRRRRPGRTARVRVMGDRPITPREAYFLLRDNPNHPEQQRLEQIIAREAYQAARYSRDVLKQRWKEAEQEIAKSDAAAILYAESIIRNNWAGWTPEEIGVSPCWAALFAEQHLGDGVTPGRLPDEMHDDLFKRAVLQEDHWAKRYLKGLAGNHA